jgi:hypothetical protein
LAPSARRAVAGATIYAARNETGLLSASTIVDAIDGACWGMLSAVGLTPLEAKIVLAAMWVSE